MRTLWQDIRYGCRMLARSPGFTAIVVVTLGISIGVTTAMLSVVDAVMFRPCPYEDPKTLVCVYETDSYVHPETHAIVRNQRELTSLASFQDWQQRNHVFSSLVGAHQWDDATIQSADRTEKTRALYVSSGFFTTLGAQPILGRSFTPEGDKLGGEPVVILSHTHWQHWFGGDPNVIGRTLIVDKQACTVVGVLPPNFRWVFQRIACGLWMPMSMYPDHSGDRNARGLVAIGRLKPGVDLSQAQAEMELIAGRLAQEHPETMGNRGAAVEPINAAAAASAEGFGKPRILVRMLAVAACVLLIACLHIASLLIARSATREQEIAVRATLGAHRLRLVRQLLVESILLAGLGTLLGLLLAYWGIAVLSALRDQSVPWYLQYGKGYSSIPWFVQVHIDGRILLYVVGLALLTCVLFGVLPAIGGSRVNLSRSLSAGRTRSAGPRSAGIRTALVVGDTAIAFVLLIGAGLLINSYARLNTGLGYEPKSVLSAWVVLDESHPPYSQPNQCLAFFEQVLDRVRRLPGVRHATVADDTPAFGAGNFPRLRIEGYSPASYRSEDREGFPAIRWQQVFPDYFRVLQIPLVKGRRFTKDDRQGTTAVMIVNESMARRFWPTGNPIGKYVTEMQEEKSEETGMRLVMREYQIVGVVGNVRHFTELKTGPAEPEVYVPYAQNRHWGDMRVMIRTNSDSRDSIHTLRSAVLSVNRDVLIRSILPLEDVIADYISTQRFGMLCLGAFAAAALVLACLGVYGATAYAVSRRTHEIGIRMALGACSSDVLTAVLRRGLGLTLIGLTIGLAGALVTTRVIRNLLYDVSPTDPLTFVCVSLLLGSAALLASVIPARRAARIDPMVALRYE